MLKTRLEILEKDYDSGLEQMIENEINVKSLEKRLAKSEPGSKDATGIQAAIITKKTNIENIQIVMDTINELIKGEKK